MAKPHTIHRPTVGVIAALLIVGAIVLWIWAPLGSNNEVSLSACVRVGLVMAALWLALPQLERIPNWLMKAALFVALLLVSFKQPRVLVLAGGIYLVVVLLRPLMEKK